jgi:hypothetical protein
MAAFFLDLQSSILESVVRLFSARSAGLGGHLASVLIRNRIICLDSFLIPYSTHCNSPALPTVGGEQGATNGQAKRQHPV